MGVVLVGVLAALVLAACGSPSSTAGTATTSPSTTERPTTSSTTTTVATSSANPAPTCDSPSNWATYDGNGMRFDYPSCWTPVHNDEVSSFSTSLVDLSNEAMRDPCTTTTNGLKTSMYCGSPLTDLVTDG